MNVERVDFFNIATRDPERSRAWYAEMLGLERDPRNPDELVAGQVTLTFWNPEDEGLEFKPDVAGFAVRVEDVEKARAELEAKGLECVGSGDTGVCRMAVFTDPDGNAVILHRRYADYE
jgi:catechol 2,3-dioxygenase-like lactoylglutathione lyase family enzyme